MPQMPTTKPKEDLRDDHKISHLCIPFSRVRQQLTKPRQLYENHRSESTTPEEINDQPGVPAVKIVL